MRLFLLVPSAGSLPHLSPYFTLCRLRSAGPSKLLGVQGPFFPLLMLCPTGASSRVSAEMGGCTTTSSMSGCRGGR